MSSLLESPSKPDAHVRKRPIRLAVIVNMVAPYTRPLFERLAERDDCELLVVSETAMERDRKWAAESSLPFDHVLLESWTLNLAPLAIGSGFKTRFDTYLYVPKHPLRALVDFAPDVVVAGGGGIWSSPVNIAAFAARGRHEWALVPWWGSFTRPRPTLPRRLANPWVKHFMRASDAWLVYGTRHVDDIIRLGAVRERVVVAPITPLLPRPRVSDVSPPPRDGVRYLFAGRLIERKGVAVLLEAFRKVTGGELWIAGDGPLMPLVEDAAARDSRIRIIGHLAADALAEAYVQADVLVVPSLYEPWGLVVHEGLAYGLPVVTTDQVGAADDLIDAGVNGLVAGAGSAGALGDAMNTVAAWSREQRARAAQHSVDKLARCSVERGADGFLRASSAAMAHRHGRPKPDRDVVSDPATDGAQFQSS